ncbi:MAG TPA: hypothetical protein VHC69_21500 [Polyangiaceae bacterium]|nr:hypothetical protein [Polyangiaceae bacterium]
MRSSARWLAFGSALLLAGMAPRVAFATDVSDELSAGAIGMNGLGGASPFVSDRLGGALDVSDALAFSADATFTRYFRSKDGFGESILQLAGASDYSLGEHWAFGADIRGSPESTARITDAAGKIARYRSSLLGGGASVEYDTAGDGPLETIGDSYFGVTAFHTNRPKKDLKIPAATLLQWRGSLGLTEVLWQDTEAGLTGTYYAYSVDPDGYEGASVFGRGGISEGAPLEPLRWSLRGNFRRRFGALKLGAYVQYGPYVDSGGFSVVTAVKAQVKASDAVRLWAQIGFQRDGGAGEALSIPWGSLGVRVVL